MLRPVATFSRKEIDDLTKIATDNGAKGLAWIVVAEDGLKSPITKFFTDEKIQEILSALGMLCRVICCYLVLILLIL